MAASLRPESPDIHLGQAPSAVISWRAETLAMLRLAWPLVIAQLAQIALFTTDVVMMGWLGPHFLGAGTLAVTFFHPFILFGIGVVSAVTPLVAQAKGTDDSVSLRRSLRQGLWISVGLTVLLTPLLWQTRSLFLLFGQAPEIARLAEDYAQAAVWSLPSVFGFIVLRALLATHDDTRIILLINVGGIFINAALNYVLMFGHWGFPRLELMGAGISSSLVQLVMFAALLGYTLTHNRYRPYEIFTRLWKPDWPRFVHILRLGLPIGLMLVAEIGLFTAASQLMGWIGPNALAAHAVALQLAAIFFMVPLGISQAATVRVGLAHGARSAEGIRKAGWVAIMLGAGFMCLSATVFLSIPETLVSLFLAPALPKNRTAFELALTFLAVAAMFQLFDGVQAVSAAVLRGLNDTAVPMALGFVGYWGVGLGLAYSLAFPLGLGGLGIWLGLAAALAAVAIVLTVRFALRERFGLTPRY